MDSTTRVPVSGATQSKPTLVHSFSVQWVCFAGRRVCHEAQHTTCRGLKLLPICPEPPGLALRVKEKSKLRRKGKIRSTAVLAGIRRVLSVLFVAVFGAKKEKRSNPCGASFLHAKSSTRVDCAPRCM